MNSIRKAIRSLAQLTSRITKKLNLEFSSSVAVGLSGLITIEGFFFISTGGEVIGDQLFFDERLNFFGTVFELIGF